MANENETTWGIEYWALVHPDHMAPGASSPRLYTSKVNACRAYAQVKRRDGAWRIVPVRIEFTVSDPVRGFVRGLPIR